MSRVWSTISIFDVCHGCSCGVLYWTYPNQTFDGDGQNAELLRVLHPRFFYLRNHCSFSQILNQRCCIFALGDPQCVFRDSDELIQRERTRTYAPVGVVGSTECPREGRGKGTHQKRLAGGEGQPCRHRLPPPPVLRWCRRLVAAANEQIVGSFYQRVHGDVHLVWYTVRFASGHVAFRAISCSFAVVTLAMEASMSTWNGS